MFDTAKIQRMTALLEKVPEKFDDVYLIPERRFFAEAVALFKRLKIPIRGIMSDITSQKELWGIPFVKTAEVSSKFNERTALIILVEKPVQFIQTTFDFKVRGGVWTIPALVIAHDEILAIYDRLTLLRTLQQYREDGLPTPALKDFATRFARGLTTFLDSRYQNVKYQFFDKRDFFKPTYDFDDTAIVIQGPIAYDNNYTVETFKLYRSIYPNVPIVVSTWKGEATNAFRKECAQNSVVLLENEPPKVQGPAHINMQLESSFQGIKFVRQNTNAEFVLKCRTDQRVQRPDFLLYFKNLLRTFPPLGNKLRKRLIGLGNFHTCKWIPFHVSDFLMFGTTDDMEKLYSIPHKTKDSSYTYRHLSRFFKLREIIAPYELLPDIVLKRSKKLKNYNLMMNHFEVPEIYIVKTLYKMHIAPIKAEKLLETYWKFLHDYLIIADENTLVFEWFKLDIVRFNFQSCYTRINVVSGNMDHACWLDIYRNFKIDWI